MSSGKYRRPRAWNGRSRSKRVTREGFRIAAGPLSEECEDDDEHAHQQIMFQPELVIGESTAL